MAYKLDNAKRMYNLVRRFPKAEIICMFLNQNIPRRTTSRSIAKCLQGIPCANLPKNGGQKIFNKAGPERHKNSLLHYENCHANSELLRAPYQRYFSRYTLKWRNRRKAVKYTANQLARISILCHRALRMIYSANNEGI